MKEEEEESNTTEETPSFTETLMESFFETYAPAGATDSGIEHKTTLEIIDEMATIADAEKWEINTALKQAGFKTTYIDGAFYWMLLPK